MTKRLTDEDFPDFSEKPLTRTELESCRYIDSLNEETFVKKKPSTLTKAEWQQLRKLSRKILAAGLKVVEEDEDEDNGHGEAA
jgi:hypothetical protein